MLILQYKTGTALGTYYDEVIADSPNAYWRLQEAGGGQFLDEIGSNNLSVSLGTGAYNQPGPLGGGQTTASFQFSSNALAETTTLPLPAGNLATSDFSIEYFIYYDNSPPNSFGSVVSQICDGCFLGNRHNLKTLFDHDAGRIVHFTISHGSGFLASNTGATLDGWTHFVFVHEPGHATQKTRIYVNGTLDASGPDPLTYTLPSDMNEFRLGGGVIGGQADEYLGVNRVSEVSIYNGTVLSDARITAHFNASQMV